MEFIEGEEPKVLVKTNTGLKFNTKGTDPFLSAGRFIGEAKRIKQADGEPFTPELAAKILNRIGDDFAEAGEKFNNLEIQVLAESYNLVYDPTSEKFQKPSDPAK